MIHYIQNMAVNISLVMNDPNISDQQPVESSNQASELSRIVSGLNTALQDNQFTLQYQPQYDLQLSTLRGFEALLRWNHPELGSVKPLDFIPLTEESRLIIPIGEWVLKEACTTLERIAPSPSELKIAVNISAVQLMDENFVDRVQNILNNSGLASHRLELELTESKLLSSLQIAERQLKKLQQLGIQVALDDFGIGYSSLNYLRKLPFNIIKIDKSFIDDIEQSPDRDITGSMIQFIKQLRYKIVAEGIESYVQLSFLKKVNCDYVQGYLFSRPVSEDRLSAMIHSTSVAARIAVKSLPTHPFP